MVTVVTELMASSYSRNNSGTGTPGSGSTNDPITKLEIPAKVKGLWLTLPNGFKFRKATNYTKFSSWVERGAPLNTETNRLANQTKGYYRTSDGGYLPGNNLYSGSMRFVLWKDIVSDWMNEPAAIPTSMRNEAITKALNNIASQEAGVGEDLATLGQTIRMLRNPVQSLVNGIKMVHADKALKPFLMLSARDIMRRGILNTAAEKYLEHVYGWRPLMQDIYGLVAMAKAQGNESLLVQGRAKASRQSSCNSVVMDAAPQQWITSDSTVDERVTCNLWARIDPEYAGTRALNQLGLANPVSLAWELVPWSFVVDWVLPIGPCLSALTAPAGLVFVNGSVALRQSASSSYTVGCLPSAGYEIVSESKGSGQARYEGYRREVLASWPLPGLWFDSDPLRLSSDKSDRGLKAIALTIANLPRGLSRH
jgi:hypothetical protein